MLVKQFVIWLVISFWIGSCFSCNDNDNVQIKLSPVEEDSTAFVLTDNKVTLYYPSAEGRIVFLVTGLDENCMISISDETVLSVGYISGGLYLEPLKLGEVVVTILDKAGHEFKFDVENVYWEENYIVEKYDFRVGGEKLSEEEKEGIIDKVKSTLLVGIGGGYQFIYTNEKRTEGIVNIYTEGWDKQFVEGTFTKTHFAGRNDLVYNLVFDDNQIEYSFWQDGSHFYFKQSLLSLFLDEYPNILYVDLEQTMFLRKIIENIKKE
mgnify:CR=1 FL=1